MSEFNLVWRKYGLRGTPYFTEPLSLEGGEVPITSFVGRKKESEFLQKILVLGQSRQLVIGAPGVGKTSLVNYVKSKVKEKYFTVRQEIELNKKMPGNEVIMLTLHAVYQELKARETTISDEKMNKLEALSELFSDVEFLLDNKPIVQLSRQNLTNLFKEIVDEVVNPRFNGLVIHYDNIDNLKDENDLLYMLSDLRDFFMTRKVTFIFVGDQALARIAFGIPKVAQVFNTEVLSVESLKLAEIEEILKERIENLRISSYPLAIPHTKEAIDLLFNIHNGIIRDILSSLSACVAEYAPSNIPYVITGGLLRRILYHKAVNIIEKLSPEERKIFEIIRENGDISPTELARRTKKIPQNISQRYVPHLENAQAIRLKRTEGRNKFYGLTPQMEWLKLKINEQEAIRQIKNKEKQVQERLDKDLREFLT